MPTKTKSICRSPPTLIGEIIKLAIKIILLTLLAWFLLMIFSCLRVWLYGWQAAIQQINKAAWPMNHHAPIAFIHIDLSNASQFLSNGFLGASAQKGQILAQAIQQFITLINSVTNLIALRCDYFFYSSPVIGIFCLLGFIEGLIQRDLRKWHNARESTLFFHRTKSLFYMSFLGGYFLFIILPVAFEPAPIFFGFAVFISLLILLTTRSFKKYL